MKESEIIFYWTKFKYPSSIKLFNILKTRGKHASFDQIDQLLKQQPTYQLHKETRRRLRGHIVAYSPNAMWFADLMDFKRYSKFNRGFKYILLCIDVFSRKAYAEAVKSKTKNETRDALKSILDRVGVDGDVKLKYLKDTDYVDHDADRGESDADYGESDAGRDESDADRGESDADHGESDADHVDYGAKVKLLQTDAGLEFLNRPVKELLEDIGIKHHAEVAANNHEAFGIIDRFCRTLRSMIEKDFINQDHVVWYDKLQDYIEVYNSTPHRGIADYTPNEVETNVKAQEAVKELNYEKQENMGEIRDKIKFNVGDVVRRKYKRPNMKQKKEWTRMTYTIKKVNYVTAVLSDGTEARIDDLQLFEGEEDQKTDNLETVEKHIKDERALKKEDLE